MRNAWPPGAIVILPLLVAGCGQPDKVETLQTPLPGLTLTFETWNEAHQASENTKLIAHYVHDGKEDTQTILVGDHVIIAEYRWARPRKLTLCYKKGLVAYFQNEVNFWVNNDLRSFHVVLKEDC